MKADGMVPKCSTNKELQTGKLLQCWSQFVLVGQFFYQQSYSKESIFRSTGGMIIWHGPCAQFHYLLNSHGLTTLMFAHSENGWTDGELVLQWLIKDYISQTK